MYIEQAMANLPAEDTAICAVGCGSLPKSGMAPMVFPYVPMQNDNPKRYANTEALQQGTLYPGLDLPFKYTGKTNKLANSELNELMALDFAVDELGLYLTTHKDDKEALAQYGSYVRAAKAAREKYEAANGPLCQATVPDGSYRWLNDPWPWNEGGNV